MTHRPRSPEELNEILRRASSNQDEVIKRALSGELVNSSDQSPINIPDWTAEQAEQKVIDVAFEDITEELTDG